MRPGEYYKYIDRTNKDNKETHCIKLLEYLGSDVWNCRTYPYSTHPIYESTTSGQHIYNNYYRVDKVH